jgi:hypothetical protein
MVAFTYKPTFPRNQSRAQLFEFIAVLVWYPRHSLIRVESSSPQDIWQKLQHNHGARDISTRNFVYNDQLKRPT